MNLPQRSLLSETERLELRHFSRLPNEKGIEVRRALAILQYDLGQDTQVILDFLDISLQTLSKWLHNYHVEGNKSLANRAYPPRTGHLITSQELELKAYLSPRTIRDSYAVIEAIKTLFNVTYSHSGVIKLLKRLGFCYSKPVLTSQFASENEQQEFIDTYQTQVRAGETILFCDAVHPVHMVKPHGLWHLVEEKPAVIANTGRERMNIQVSLNVQTGEVIERESLTINAESFILFLERLLTRLETNKIIHIYVDNARYYKAKIVAKWLKEHENELKIHFIPRYSPHLNPIERLFGVMHKYKTHNKTYKTFKEFADQILTFFRKDVKDDWEKIKSSVSDNFRVKNYTNLKIVQ